MHSINILFLMNFQNTLKLYSIIILHLPFSFLTKCCTNNNCSTFTNCTDNVAHCMLAAKVDINSSYGSLQISKLLNVDFFKCWVWDHETSLCPSEIGKCYSAHKNGPHVTFCCAGDFCNNPDNLTCEVKDNNFQPNISYNATPFSTPASRPQANYYLYILIIAAVAIIIVMSVLLRYYWKRINLISIRNRISKKHSSYNGVSLISDQNTCISKITKDNLSLTPRNVFNDELLQISSYYEKSEKKSIGKFGEIWLGYIKHNRVEESVIEHVAIKIFRPGDESSWETEIDMYRYIRNRCSKILKYVGCDKVYEGNKVKELWLVTQYIECGSLHDYLYESNNIRPKWSQVLRSCIDISGGLSYLHEDGTYQSAQHISGKPSIAHRDLKSRNILIRKDWTACIADLGLAVSFQGNKSLNDLHLQVGTQRYMAPEVLEGAINFSRDSFLGIDVYAMALIMWEVFSQCNDFENLSEHCNIQVPVYRQPFEQELGPQITIESLQSWVVNDNRRPQFPIQFAGFSDGLAMWKTITECWDRDAEARLSSSCVFERLNCLYQKFLHCTSKADELCDHQISDSDPFI